MRDWAEVRSRLEDFLKFPHEGGLSSDIRAALQRESKQAVALDLAWGLVANAGGGNWDRESPEWKAAAEKWRDDFWPQITADVAERAEVIALRQRVEELEAAAWLVGEDQGVFLQGGDLALLCSDTFGYAVADCEKIALSSAPKVKAIVEREGWPGVVRWIAEVRGSQPIREVVTRMKLIDKMRERAEAAEAKLAKVVEIADHGIPFYAYGDNEAAVEMSHRMEQIRAAAEGE